MKFATIKRTLDGAYELYDECKVIGYSPDPRSLSQQAFADGFDGVIHAYDESLPTMCIPGRPFKQAQSHSPVSIVGTRQQYGRPVRDIRCDTCGAEWVERGT